VHLRPEAPADHATVHDINVTAFGGEVEARLVALLREQAQPLVSLVGHSDFYPRFGFLPAARFGLICEYDVPAQAFMAIELGPYALRDAAGIVSYHPAFAGL